MARIYLSPPHMGTAERDLLLQAFDSNWIAPLGPHVDALEREFSARHDNFSAAALSCGTAALHLALRLLGVTAGDEVFVSTLTFAASVNPILYQGGTPVFIDADAATWNMDANLLADEMRKAASRNALPKAVIVVDLYGQCADFDPILEVCSRYDVPVIEDAAEALGATYRGRPAGSLGTLGAFSFNGNKIITASGGGMLISPQDVLIKRARHLATQAREPAPHYEHIEVGYNYRMSNLLAAIARGQLAQLDDRVARRRAINAFYRRTLAEVPGIAFMPEASFGQMNCWLTCITVDPQRFGSTREAIRRRLEAQDIESRPVWKPMHLQPVFSRFRAAHGDVAALLFDRGLCLPSGSSLDEDDAARVVDVIRGLL